MDIILVLKLKRKTADENLYNSIKQSPMYLFHQDYIKNKYGNTLRLLLRDTDSLMYEIETKNVYEDFSMNKVTFQ